MPPDKRVRQALGKSAPAFGERRQLTVMFCDIVSSTELASKLDPEEYAEILGAYHARCADAIVRYGGYVAQYLGDGVYAYFGYPKAVEDAASRAVRAAFELLRGLQPARVGDSGAKPLSVRIGIHTGVVVMNDVGDGAHLERIAMGDVPHIAARVQSHAAVDSIAITSATRELLRDEFTLEALGATALRGVPKPIALFRVIGSRQWEREHRRSPMIGRAAELALLQARYGSIPSDGGALVTVSGEPGIGKTRLLQAFRDSFGAGHELYYESRCSAYHSATAHHPLLDLVRRRFELGESEGERTRVDQLYQLFADQSDREPVVLAIEDLHWADPSTLEWLSALIELLPRARTLLVLSFRSGFELPWPQNDRTTHIELDRLNAVEASLLIENTAHGKRLPPRLLQELLDRTDGIPMFIEESTRMLLDSPHLVDRGNRYDLVDETLELGVPSTIQDSLMARLDQLSSAKEVAQLAAILGRTFHYEVIAAIWSAEERLRVELSRLVDAGLLLQHGLPPEAIFSFKHALIQDVSYSSTLKRVRRATHGEVAKLLVGKFPRLAASEPEVIAHHFTEAGLADEAIRHWKLAADQALACYANVEAIHHLQHALQLVPSVEDTRARAELELRLLMSLGPPLVATQGYSSSELRRAYDRAQELCRNIDDASALWAVLYVLFLYYTVRGEAESAARLANELGRAAQGADDPNVQLEMCIVSGHVFWSGRLKEASAAFERAVETYDLHIHSGHAARFGHDPLVSALAYLGWIYAIEANPSRARECANRAIEHARALQHPHSLGCALAFSAVTAQLCDDYASSRAYAIEARALSLEHSLAHWLADADICHGFADVIELGHPDGLTHLLAGLNAWDALGSRLWRTHQLGLLAEAHLHLRNPRAALETVQEARALVERHGERYYEAELVRLEGVARLQLDPHAEAEAAACHRRAMQIALDQGALLFVERAAAALENLAS